MESIAGRKGEVCEGVEGGGSTSVNGGAIGIDVGLLARWGRVDAGERNGVPEEVVVVVSLCRESSKKEGGDAGGQGVGLV